MSSKFIGVKGYPGLVRDKRSGAILNTDENEIKKALLRKQRKKEEAERIKSLETDVESIKDDIGQIKSLLLKMIEEKDGAHNN